MGNLASRGQNKYRWLLILTVVLVACRGDWGEGTIYPTSTSAFPQILQCYFDLDLEGQILSQDGNPISSARVEFHRTKQLYADFCAGDISISGDLTLFTDSTGRFTQNLHLRELDVYEITISATGYKSFHQGHLIYSGFADVREIFQAVGQNRYTGDPVISLQDGNQNAILSIPAENWLIIPEEWEIILER